MFVAEAKFNGSMTAFIWDKTEACPGHFLQVFEPIDNVIFATNMSRYVLDKKALIVYEASNAILSWTLLMNNLTPRQFGHGKWDPVERDMYTRYIPIPGIRKKIATFVKQHDIFNAAAMHIRLTDLDSRLKTNRKLSLQHFFDFVENCPAGQQVFLITDNPSTQQLFLSKYGTEKILVYENIADSKGAGNVSTPVVRLHGKKDISGVPEDRRFTTIEHTLIDILIAAHAQSFKPSAYSSVSDLVKIFSGIRKVNRGWYKRMSYN